MKKVVYAGIGGRSFTLDDDAYARLESYLILYKSRLKEEGSSEVLAELEARIAELFTAEVGTSGQRVVDIDLVKKVIAQLGMPDGGDMPGSPDFEEDEKPLRKLYRDPLNRRIAGVCSGLALYFDVDTTLVRIIMLAAIMAGSLGFWIYVILWIAEPKAETPMQQCELRGLAPTAENLAQFSKK